MSEPREKAKKNKALKNLAGKASQSSTRAIFPQRKRRTIKLDGVHPADLARMDVRFFCDDCSHYDRQAHRCTMGYLPQHTRREQMALYELTGKMAFCRFLEID